MLVMMTMEIVVIGALHGQVDKLDLIVLIHHTMVVVLPMMEMLSMGVNVQ